MQVAQTIREQLGGRRFLVMTGAKNLVGGDNTLSMQLPGNARMLGGHGCVSVRYHPGTLRSMERRGLLTRDGYWKSTPLGERIINDAKS